MKKRDSTVLIILVIIFLTMVGGLITYLLIKSDKPNFVCGDEFCDIDNGENPKNCPKDCRGIIVSYCGDGMCGESHFGVSSGRLNLKDEISDLGDIYSRINIGLDVHGWRVVKDNQEGIDLCKSCCREQPECIDECVGGAIYYCEPENREKGIVGKNIADGFYADDYEILFSVWPGSYGKNEPKDIKDILSYEYPANVPVYKDYIKYLLQQYPNVKYWEVGNEADNPQFWRDTAANYIQFVTLTSNEIKSYCPDCKVGISLVGPYSPDKWFNAITSICNTIDFLDLHQYHSETMDELREFEENDLTKWKNSCPGVEIISTETGIPSEPITFKGNTWELGTSETKQAQDSIKYLTMMFNAGYSKIYYYLFNHDFVPGVPDIFERVGLLYEDFTPKKSYYSYKTMIEKVDYFTSIEKLDQGQYKYTFSHKGPVYVLWCDSGSCTPHSSIPTANIRITDYLGNGLTQINLTNSPIFIEQI